MKFIKNLINKNSEERMMYICNTLNQLGYKYTLQKVENMLGNIIVDLSVDEAECVVFCAHYDCVSGSPGANDNGSGVSVLLHLLHTKVLQQKNIIILFSACEEDGGKGCETFVKSHYQKRVIGMVNIDSCGYGEIVAVARRKASFFKFLDKVKKVKVISFLPYGDECIFEDCGTPSISISALSCSDFLYFKKVSYFIENNLVIPDRYLVSAQ